jgi:hypothetical protein
MPDPHHVAIHAAIREVLNIGVARRFFDELLNKNRCAILARARDIDGGRINE